MHEAGDRPRADAILQGTDARFQIAWEASSDAMAISGPDGIVLAVNPAYLDLYGYDASEVVGHSFAVIFPEEFRTWAEAQHRAVFASEDQPQTYHSSVRRKDGTERWVEARAHFVIENGERTALVSIIRDITETRRAQEALQESEERLRMALDAAGMGVWRWDPVADHSVGDAPFRQLLDLPRNEDISLASALEHYIHPDDRERYAAAAAAMLNPHDPVPLSEEIRWRRVDGSERWLQFTGQAAFDGEGDDRRAVFAIGTVLDVTQRRQAEEELRASEERFRTLIQRSADAVQLIDATGTIRYSSDSVESVIGYRPDEIEGQRVAPYLHPDDADQVEAWIAGVAATPGGTGALTYRVRHKDGSWVWVETTITNHLETPRIQALVGNFRNVTERKRAEIEREAFAAAAAHDLKTPLTSLMGQAQLLLRRIRRGRADPEMVEAGMESVIASVRQMVSMIDEMMDAARLGAGRVLELNRTEIDLVSLARDACAEGRMASSRHLLRLESSVPELIGAWDGPRLERVLGNLVDNAIKYSPAGGEVVMRLTRHGEGEHAWAELSIHDQGVGIPANEIPYMFERFRRGTNVSGTIRGTGLGLFGARSIVRQHGGEITVESEEGVGSTFTLRLPLTPGDDPDSDHEHQLSMPL